MAKNLSEEECKKMKQAKFFVMIAMNGKTICENRRGYNTREEAEAKAEIWFNDGFEVGILEL